MVSMQPGKSAGFQELADFCREKVGKWEIPKHVVFVDDLPKGVTGKIAKFAIREALKADPDQFPW